MDETFTSQRRVKFHHFKWRMWNVILVDGKGEDQRFFMPLSFNSVLILFSPYLGMFLVSGHGINWFYVQQKSSFKSSVCPHSLWAMLLMGGGRGLQCHGELWPSSSSVGRDNLDLSAYNSQHFRQLCVAQIMVWLICWFGDFVYVCEA